ncbi:5-formyltetrahydrofolate cyclo-ligase [uncultured Jannaschia sp.]|uniref:5-formyltetrahydrofolate cyclo-ligase n=1 Tax=uncultured Jannaschia sp. TaxID=293347 RepID=UPI00260516C8|nr:5-formyltetrahydrofolate cyclo-ligase [uncultured Jannaschia sp.]
MTEQKDSAPCDSYASPPCMAHEVDPAYFDPPAVESDQTWDVIQWRKSERARLRAARQALSVDLRNAVGQELASHLHGFLNARFGGGQSQALSAYWPIKGEPDLRPLMTELHAAGVTIALPLVETKAAPLVFRRWTPEMKMIRGHWNIPVPPPDTPIVAPEIVLVPLVGWDEAGYRLGYGGGYFDRTLAALGRRPFAIGVGLQAARLATIHPQPHDIPLDAIITEAGVQVEKSRVL